MRVPVQLHDTYLDTWYVRSKFWLYAIHMWMWTYVCDLPFCYFFASVRFSMMIERLLRSRLPSSSIISLQIKSKTQVAFNGITRLPSRRWSVPDSMPNWLRFFCLILQLARERQRGHQAIRDFLLERDRPEVQAPQGSWGQDLHRRNHHLQSKNTICKIFREIT